MRVLVDTSVWSLALRRKAIDLNEEERRIVDALASLIRQGQAVLIGDIRQEILSGIRDESVFRRLREQLRAFPDEPLVTDDYEEAARCYNRCRAGGVQGSAIDLLICAVAQRRELEIFSTDVDFQRYAQVLSLGLFTPKA